MNRPSLSSLLVLFLAVFLAGSTAGAQEQPNTGAPPPSAPHVMHTSTGSLLGSAANHLYVPWDEYAHENLHVVSVIQDHRTYPKPLAPSLYKIAMSNLLAQSDQDTRIFQFHMGVHRNLVDVRSPNCESFFETAELEWQELDSGGSLRWRVLPPLRCVGMMPKGTSHRFSSGTKFLDFVERCAYAIPERIVPTLLDPTSNALFRIIGAGGSIAFPLHQVLHFPHVRRFIDLKPRPQEGYPTAPWYDPEDPHLSRIVQRTSGDQARDRVAAICTKKYSWTTDDEYWMLWTLDVVGVDHLVIYVSTRDLPMAKVEEAVASHPGLAGRVTLIDMDIPCRGATTKWRETYAYLILSITWDIFVRFQGDFDYAFLIDLDEYVDRCFSFLSSFRRSVASLSEASQVHRALRS